MVDRHDADAVDDFGQRLSHLRQAASSVMGQGVDRHDETIHHRNINRRVFVGRLGQLDELVDELTLAVEPLV